MRIRNDGAETQVVQWDDPDNPGNVDGTMVAPGAEVELEEDLARIKLEEGGWSEVATQ